MELKSSLILFCNYLPSASKTGVSCRKDGVNTAISPISYRCARLPWLATFKPSWFWITSRLKIAS